MNRTIDDLLAEGQENAAGGAWHEMTDLDGQGIYYTLSNPARAFLVTLDTAFDGERFTIEEVETAISISNVADELEMCGARLAGLDVIDCDGDRMVGLDALQVMIEARIQCGAYRSLHRERVDGENLNGLTLREYVGMLAGVGSRNDELEPSM